MVRFKKWISNLLYVCKKSICIIQNCQKLLYTKIVVPEDTIAAALAAKKVQRFLLDNAQVTTVTDAPEKE